MSASDVVSTDLAPRLAEAEAAPPRPQYMTGFDGMAVEPFSEKIRAVLAEPPPPEAIEIKPNGIVFVPGVYYRRQLTRAFGAGGWAIVPRGPARVMGQLVVYPGALYCLGRFVAEAVGECAYIASNSSMTYASCVEGAKTDALSRCCKDLGMATQLWDKAWRDQWMADYAEQYQDNKGQWKWKVRGNRPVQDVDLMAGAGGVAPASKEAAPAAPKESAPAKAASGVTSLTTSPPMATPPSAASSKTSASSPTTTSAPAATAPPSTASADTGEAASDEQKAALRGHVKRLGWKGHFAKMWLKGLVGFDNPDSLTADQCTNACMLAERWGQDGYKPLLEDLRKDGLVRPEQAA